MCIPRRWTDDRMSDVKVKHEFTYTQRRDRINVHLAELRASTSEEFILSYVLQQLHRSTYSSYRDPFPRFASKPKR